MSRYIQSSRRIIPSFYLVEKQDIFGSGAFQVFYQSCNWVPPAPKIRVRVVGAGGGADCHSAGGGGGFAIGCFDVDTSTTYAITVGNGVNCAAGETSSFGSLISATGGGFSPVDNWACCCNKGGCGIGGFCNTCGGQGGTYYGGGGAAGSWIGNGGNGKSNSCTGGDCYGAGGSVGTSTANAAYINCFNSSVERPTSINYITSNPRFPFDSFTTFLPPGRNVGGSSSGAYNGTALPLPGIGGTPGYQCCCLAMDGIQAGVGGGGTTEKNGSSTGYWAGTRPGLGGGSGSAYGSQTDATACGRTRFPGGNGVVVVEW